MMEKLRGWLKENWKQLGLLLAVVGGAIVVAKVYKQISVSVGSWGLLKGRTKQHFRPVDDDTKIEIEIDGAWRQIDLPEILNVRGESVQITSYDIVAANIDDEEKELKLEVRHDTINLLDMVPNDDDYVIGRARSRLELKPRNNG